MIYYIKFTFCIYWMARGTGSWIKCCTRRCLIFMLTPSDREEVWIAFKPTAEFSWSFYKIRAGCFVDRLTIYVAMYFASLDGNAKTMQLFLWEEEI